MYKIAVFDTSIRSLNLGDQIIMDAVYRELNDIFSNSFLINIPSHLYSDLRTMFSTSKLVDKFFVGGTNILTPRMHRYRQWKVTLIDSFLIKNKSILFGTGWNSYSQRTSPYTRFLLNRLLSRKYIHSVRDSYTRERLMEIGIMNVLNTGCPTTWSLTPDHCLEIPVKKARHVVTTITDYRKDYERDRFMLSKLLDLYETVTLWIQGSNDYEYLQELNIHSDRLYLIQPKLHKYDEFLKNNDVDFVGTRLHAGIRAMQFKKRTVIIGVDNRAKEMGADLNLNVLNREEIEDLEVMLIKEFQTKVTLPIREINEWKNQFKIDVVKSD
jgi:Uncharacterized conserved protein